MTSEDNENHHVPKFQAEHDGRGEGEPNEGPDILEGQPRKSPPPISAPNNDIDKLCNCNSPVGDIIPSSSSAKSPAEEEDEEPKQEDVKEQGQESNPCHDADLALGL